MAHGVQRILVVEDNDAFRETVRDLLRDAGYKVRGARSVRKATKRLTKHAFDLVLTDFDLSDATGLDVLEVANTRNPAIKLIVMSASAEFSAQAIQSGAARFLEKPFGAKTLLDTIAELLRHADEDEAADHADTDGDTALPSDDDVKD
ncbi:MAG: response regulator [Aggregatilineales bacterium]